MSYVKSKYIIVKMGSIPQPFIFNEIINHKDVARAVSFGNTVESAGFCYVNEVGRYTCYGESPGMKLKSRPEDSDILNRMLAVQELQED